jgi:hypothetical protein
MSKATDPRAQLNRLGARFEFLEGIRIQIRIDSYRLTSIKMTWRDELILHFELPPDKDQLIQLISGSLAIRSSLLDALHVAQARQIRAANREQHLLAPLRLQTKRWNKVALALLGIIVDGFPQTPLRTQ